MTVEVTIAGDPPVSLAEAKAWLRLDTDAEDALVGRLLDAAAEWAAGVTGKSLTRRTLRVTLDAGRGTSAYGRGPALWPFGHGAVLRLPYGPVYDVGAVEVWTGEAWETVPDADVEARGDEVWAVDGGGAWPAPSRLRAAYRVTYEAGYDPCPSAVAQAVLRSAARHYHEREAAGPDPAALELLRPYTDLAGVG